MGVDILSTRAENPKVFPREVFDEFNLVRSHFEFEHDCVATANFLDFGMERIFEKFIEESLNVKEADNFLFHFKELQLVLLGVQVVFEP